MTPSEWSDAQAAGNVNNMDYNDITQGQLGAIAGINAFSHWQIAEPQNDGHNSLFGFVQKKLPMCGEKLLEDYGVRYLDGQDKLTEDTTYSWPYDDDFKKGDKLQVWLIADWNTAEIQQLDNVDNGGLSYIELGESSANFEYDTMCSVADKLTKEKGGDKDASLSGIATAASALFLAVASIAF